MISSVTINLIIVLLLKVGPLLIKKITERFGSIFENKQQVLSCLRFIFVQSTCAMYNQSQPGVRLSLPN